MQKYIFPFVEIQGQEELKLAIILNLIDPKISGVLIRGEKGTGKSTAVRGIGELMQRHNHSLRVVELPINATEDRVSGSIDIERVLKTGEKSFQEGILAKAHENILYIDEINLLEDYLVDLILDAAAMGVNTVERDTISYSHPSEFILIGTMNPEEGDIRPQLMDRFGFIVDVQSEKDKDSRKRIIKKRMEYSLDPESFVRQGITKEEELVDAIVKGQKNLEAIEVSEEILDLVVDLSIKLQVDGHRADLVLIRASRAYAAFVGVNKVEKDHVHKLARMVYSHRLRKKPFEDVDQSALDQIEEIIYG